jgi:uncharacterized membrane protein
MSSWLDVGAARAMLYGLVAAGIVHIAITFATPQLLGTGAYERLADQLPNNRMIVLGPPTAQAQLLPYQEPHTHYALCHYDATAAPVVARAFLPSSGWTFALYSSTGDNFYVVPGQDQRQTDVNVVLIPAGDQFAEYVPETQGAAASATQVALPSPTGLIVVRAPVKARAYRAEIEAQLARAACMQTSPRPRG